MHFEFNVIIEKRLRINNAYYRYALPYYRYPGVIILVERSLQIITNSFSCKGSPFIFTNCQRWSSPLNYRRYASNDTNQTKIYTAMAIVMSGSFYKPFLPW